MTQNVKTPRSPGRFRRWLEIREGEGRPILLIIILACLFGIYSAAYFTTGTAAFLSTVDPDSLKWLLPVLYIVSGLSAIAIRSGFPRLERRLEYWHLLFFVIGLLVLLNIVFITTIALLTDRSVVVLICSVMFVTVAPALVLLDVTFWKVVNPVFNAEQHQRLNRFITHVSVAATAFGFLIYIAFIIITDVFFGNVIDDYVNFGPTLGPTVVVIVLCLLPIRTLSKFPINSSSGYEGTTITKAHRGAPRNSYIMILLMSVMLLIVVHYLIDYNLLNFLTLALSGDRRSFWKLGLILAAFFLITKIIEWIYQTFLTKWLNRFFGPEYGLIALPAALVVCVILATIFRATEIFRPIDQIQAEVLIWIFFVLKFVEIVLRGPSFEPSFSGLYFSLPDAIKAGARNLVSLPVQLVAVVIAGLFLLLVNNFTGWNDDHRLWALGTVSFALLVSVLFIRRHHWQQTAKSISQLTTSGASVSKILEILPMYTANFPGEAIGSSTAKRTEAFKYLAALPDHRELRDIRSAAARRSINEIKVDLAETLLSEEKEAVFTGGFQSSFMLMSPPLSGVRRDEAILILLRDWRKSHSDKSLPAIATDIPAKDEIKSSKQIHAADNPFPGLRPYEPEEARLFFGRGVHTQELMRKLRRQRFLAVVGTSGSGKSSLVRAGLIPALCEGGLRGSGSNWRVAILRPGGDPVGELARTLAKRGIFNEITESDDEYDFKLQATLIETALRRSALGLSETVRQAQLAETHNLLIVVDQFEEIFRFKRETEDRHANEDAAAFVKLLIEASGASDTPVYVVLTMRSDYLGDCVEFRDLPETINDAQYLIPRLARDQRREIITAPIETAGARITPRLVQRLLNDIGENPDQLPIMQHALMRTWDAWSASGDRTEPLDMVQYDSIGRTASALSQHADEIYFGTLKNDHERQIAERLFRALTDQGQDGRGVRRASRLDKLCEIVNADIDDIKTVIEAFRQPGCSFLMPPAGTDLKPDTVIDISHESLMRVWERLRIWVDAETASARIYKRLAETAILNSEGKAGLWNDPDLSQALAWREAEKPNEVWSQHYHPGFTTAMEFLDKSDQAARRARRKLRNQIIGIGVFISAVAIGFFLLWAQAQSSLNQVKVFVDADRVDQLKNDCPMLFSQQPLTNEQIGLEARQRCEKALEAIPELVGGFEAHKKTRDDLSIQGGLQYETAKILSVDLGFFQRSSVFAERKNYVEMLKAFERWDDALQAIAKNPLYQKLTLSPQAGLVPLGKDPDSDLWEFAHVLSGVIPARNNGQLDLNDDSSVVLVLVPGGTFQMGSETGDSDEKPVHTVTLLPYFISKYELTQEQWHRLTGKRPSRFEGERLPVEIVSFDDIAILSQWQLRLPTEAEWEYAARAGTQTEYWWGDDLGENNANCANCGSEWDNKSTAPVGSFRPNPWGLYDTSGNVWEWVQDWKGDYPRDVVVDPIGPSLGGYRVLRGGSWLDDGRDLRSAYRLAYAPGVRLSFTGLRPARGQTGK